MNDFDLDNILYDDIQFEPTPIPYKTISGYLVPKNNPQLGVHSYWRDDYSPDFYLVQAPGFQNKFYLEKDLSVCPYDNCNYLVNRFKPVFFDEKSIKSELVKREYDLPGYGGEFDHERNAKIKNFTFTDNKGFKYKFSDPIDISTRNYASRPLNYWIPYAGVSGQNTNWKLSEIISFNSNNKVSYQYENFVNHYLHPQLIRNNSRYTDDFNMGGLVKGTSVNYYNTRSVTIYGNTKRLKKISSNDVEIIFSYDDNRIDYAGGRLKTIEITNKYSGIVINTFTFYHSYFIPNETCTEAYDCYRLRLDRITDSNSGDYNFTYDNGNSDYKFPKRSSSKIDFAGYYNGNISDIKIFPDNMAANVSVNPNYYPHSKLYYYEDLQEDNYIPFALKNKTPTDTYGDIDLSPNTSSLIGLLTNIKYPTKGELKLIYENDQFNYLGFDYILGSSRVKSMELLDSDGTMSKKINYEYKLNDGQSSGLISGFIPPSDNGSHALVVGLELLNNNTVLYSKTTENIEGKGKIEYSYSNFDKFPDRFGKLGTCSPGNGWCTNFISGLKKSKELKYPYINIYKPDVRRGLLERKKIFDNNNKIVKEIYYEYGFVKKDSLLLESAFTAGPPSSDPIRFGSPNFSGGRTNYIYVFTNKIIKDSNKEYFNDTFINTDNTYYYDQNHNDLIKSLTKLPNETIIETSYNYAEEKANIKLINANMIGIPLETTVVKKQNALDSGKTISKTESKYENPNHLFPTSVLLYDFQNTASTEITYDQYDSKGNLLQYTTKEGIVTSIIWGYNGTQPIAKIVGLSYNLVSGLATDIITASNNDASNPSTEDTLISAFEAFRNLQQLKETQISTYTYDPLIGVTSITPPSGIREIYKYDSANRLENIKDINGKLLKEFKYNYKH